MGSIKDLTKSESAYIILSEGVKAGGPNMVIVEVAGLTSCPPPPVIRLSGPKGTFVVWMLMHSPPLPLQPTHHKRVEEATDEPEGDWEALGLNRMTDCEVKRSQLAYYLKQRSIDMNHIMSRLSTNKEVGSTLESQMATRKMKAPMQEILQVVRPQVDLQGARSTIGPSKLMIE